ncbi:hypothetical protein [Salinibacter ruber]|uniref:Outer membrane protein beta-barrel domain-containing protein n=1 Tax=Salinibacter ruber TaxID=146919 RepID=A0A9X2ZTS4_9BACT|nr:hypothetical protein [Salinibacter ruber]MCS3658429.1 hypothetical protein [Salinibacter ruber]MCS3952867.1 hypothetical protein [Salinibacter ruber]MCS4119082.1 hypothetical protein [Salinibacter ruber]MCS4155388.1 hypothetical protein [Salinibacter ruber]MCS4171921.1 hypothetical protein [Salinibacter ruber]
MKQRHQDATMWRVLFGGLLAGLILIAVPPSAVAQRPDADEDDDDDGPTALSVGNLSSDFTLGGSGGYNYDGSARALMVSGPNGSLMVDYASGLGTGQFDRDTRRTIGAEALFGGNATLFDEFLRLPISVYIPIRINLDYRYLQPRNPDQSNLHRGGAGLGAGGGAQLQLPVGPDFIKDNLYVRGSALLVPAVATTLNGGNDETARTIGDDTPISASRTRMRRTLDLNLEAHFTELIGEDTGIMAGYTFRAYGRSREEPSSVGDVIDAATLSGSYVQTNVQHMIRVGLTW